MLIFDHLNGSFVFTFFRLLYFATAFQYMYYWIFSVFFCVSFFCCCCCSPASCFTFITSCELFLTEGPAAVFDYGTLVCIFFCIPIFMYRRIINDFDFNTRLKVRFRFMSENPRWSKLIRSTPPRRASQSHRM
uniref:Uncharacterized protein n=1 Tax=Rhipicephalus pulchellus TaxID=72859 RepID=L7M1X8_RHIPC